MRTRSIIIALTVVIIVQSVAIAGIVFADPQVAPVKPTGSMQPTLEGGDLVVTVAPGDVSAGEVIVYERGGAGGEPVIHRAHFHVEAGENWYDRADPRHLGGADSCADLNHCPAPRDGWITKGDNNPVYDQAGGVAPVERDWIVGKSVFVVPA